MRVEVFANDFSLTAGPHRRAETRVSPQWLAERVWEDEGGRVKHPRQLVMADHERPERS